MGSVKLEPRPEFEVRGLSALTVPLGKRISNNEHGISTDEDSFGYVDLFLRFLFRSRVSAHGVNLRIEHRRSS